MRAHVHGPTRKGVQVEFLKEILVLTGKDSLMANLMLSGMGAFAEFECSLIREHQKKASPLRSNTAYKEKDPHTGLGSRTGPGRRLRRPPSRPSP